MSQFTFGYGNQGFGNVLTDPVAPPITGGQALKFAAFAFLGIWLLKQFTSAVGK